MRVLVFAKGEKEREAEEAGADFVGGDDLVKKIQDESWLDFDTVIATPDMMGLVGRIGKVLGPRGLMPNPKVGTVTFDVAKAVREVKAGKVEYRVDKAGIVHVPIGKRSLRRREAARQRARAARQPGARQAGGGQGQLRAEHRGRHDHGTRRAGSTRSRRARRVGGVRRSTRMRRAEKVATVADAARASSRGASVDGARASIAA